MTTRTYTYIMTTLSVIGLVAMLVAMSAISKERNRVTQEVSMGGHQVALIPVGSQQVLSDSLGTVADFELTNQSGQVMKRSDLNGKIWVVDFIFTSCESICPTMTKNLVTVQEAFSDSEDVRFVSISVDPVTDTPEVLAQFGEKYGADPERWDFLTGPKDYVQEISYKSFMLATGEEMTNHSPKFILVDRDGDIRGLYIGIDLMDVDRLKRDIQTLLQEPVI